MTPKNLQLVGLRPIPQFTEDVDAAILVEAKEEERERQVHLPSIRLIWVDPPLVFLSNDNEEKN